MNQSVERITLSNSVNLFGNVKLSLLCLKKVIKLKLPNMALMRSRIYVNRGLNVSDPIMETFEEDMKHYTYSLKPCMSDDMTNMYIDKLRQLLTYCEQHVDGCKSVNDTEFTKTTSEMINIMNKDIRDVYDKLSEIYTAMCISISNDITMSKFIQTFDRESLNEYIKRAYIIHDAYLYYINNINDVLTPTTNVFDDYDENKDDEYVLKQCILNNTSHIVEMIDSNSSNYKSRSADSKRCLAFIQSQYYTPNMDVIDFIKHKFTDYRMIDFKM